MSETRALQSRSNRLQQWIFRLLSRPVAPVSDVKLFMYFIQNLVRRDSGAPVWNEFKLVCFLTDCQSQLTDDLFIGFLLIPVGQRLFHISISYLLLGES